MDIIQYTTKTKARKTHTCDLCGGEISVGENYLKSVYKDDYVVVWETHTYCEAIAQKLKMYDDMIEGLTSDDFQDIINETYAKIIGGRNGVDRFTEKLDFVISHFNI